LRESGFGGVIEVFASGGLPVYNPMLTSYYAAGKIPYDFLFPYGDGIFGKYGAVLHVNTPVTRLSVKDRSVTSAAGETFFFDKCLIATGASPFVPPIPGADPGKIFTMRTVEYAQRLKDAMEKLSNKKGRALVVGASMVGVKLVELFWEAGMKVVLTDMADRIFPLAAHPDCSRAIEDRLRAMNVELRFSTAIDKITDLPEGFEAHFKGNSGTVQADFLMMCAGVRANLSFVDRSEIETQQGVLVNSRMESGAEGVYAAGDAAQGMNLQSGQRQVIGLWANARRQGYTAGCNMAGVPREYAGEILHNITHFMGMDFVGLGEAGDGIAPEFFGGKERFAQMFYKNGRLDGVNFLDFYTEAGVFKNLIVKQALQAQGGGAALERASWWVEESARSMKFMQPCGRP
jgi:NADPH-dependent 2,4-dienoyl-CoA reductase/sulfur reductase-like enzyme